jgi:hypothetical protein
VIDFGLAGVLDRFERTFGARLTNYLLGLIGSTLVVVCLGLIASTIMPLIWWFIEKDETLENIHLARGLAALLAFVFFVVMIVNIIASYYERRSLDREKRRALQEANDILDSAKDLHASNCLEVERIMDLAKQLNYLEKTLRRGPP